MSLQFLSKKSWHTGKLKNQERVWVEEQKAEAEKKKVMELQKQLEEERQMHELRQIQRASGHVVDDRDGSLDWMYEGPRDTASTSDSTMPTFTAEERETLLLGKSVKSTSMAISDVKTLHGSGAASGANFISNNSSSARNDTFSRLHEDPLLVMRAGEQHALSEVTHAQLAKMRAEIEARVKNSVQAMKVRPEHRALVGESDDKLEQQQTNKKREKEKKGKKEKKEKKEKKRKKDKEKKEKKEHKHKTEESESRKRRRSDSSSTSSDGSVDALPLSSDLKSLPHKDSTRMQDNGTRRKKRWGESDILPLSGASANGLAVELDHLPIALNAHNPSANVAVSHMELQSEHRRAASMEMGSTQRSSKSIVTVGNKYGVLLNEADRELRLLAMQREADAVDEARRSRVLVAQAEQQIQVAQAMQQPMSRGATFLGDLKTAAYVDSDMMSMSQRLHLNKQYNQRGSALSDGTSVFLRRP